MENSEHIKAIEKDYNFVVRFTVFMMLASRVYYNLTPSLIYKVYAPYSLIPALTQIPQNVSMWIYYATMAALAWLFVTPNNRVPAVLILLSCLLHVLQDFTSFRHTLYMQGFTLVSLVMFPGISKEYRLNAVKIMLCGVYFWAGFHKINLTFYEQIFPHFVINVYDFHNPAHSALVQYAALAVDYSVPFVEAAIGILLLFPATRKLGSAIALAMFIVILVCVRPPMTNINASKGILMWNAWLYIMEARLFVWGRNLKTPFFLFTPGKLCKVSIGLFCIAPFLAIWFSWYYIFGFKMYSGNSIRGEMSFAQNETFSNVPQPLQSLLIKKRVIKDTEWMETVEDSYIRANAPFMMKVTVAGLCPYLDYPQEAKLRILYAPWFYTTERESEIFPMCPQGK